jgi:hypothetical protein
MQEQNFEKQVRDKMEEIALAPSAPVWMKVEEEIKRKKQKRRIIFWILPMAVLLGGGIYFYSSSYSKNISANSYSVNAGEIKEQRNILFPPSNAKNNSPRNLDNKKRDVLEAGKNEHESEAVENKKTISVYYKPRRIISTHISTIHSSNNTSEKLTKEDLSGNNIKDAINSGNSDVIVESSSTNSPGQKDQMKDVRPADSISTTTIPTSNPAADQTKEAGNEESKTPVIIQSNKNKWLFAVYAGAGTSLISNNLFPGGNKTTNSLSNPSSVGSSSYLPPSATTMGFSWQVGFSAGKKISRRLQLNAGLDYHYFSTHNMVGQKVVADSPVVRSYATNQPVGVYYKNDRTNKFTNEYYIMELPLILDWQVHKRIPLDLGIGVSVEALLGSHSLYYDSRYNAWYEMPKMLNKVQLHFSSEMNYRLFAIKDKSISAGLYFQYGITRIENGYPLHLSSSGIRMQFSF